MSGTGERRTRPRPPYTETEWHELAPLLDAVLDAPPDRRDALVAELSGGDVATRERLAGLVAECAQPYPLLDAPAADRFPALFGDEPAPVPKWIGERYRVEREIGRGGMAIVYVARDMKHDREVAIKVVRPELAAILGRARFLREIGIAARLRHPHIVPLYDSGEAAVVFHPPTATGGGATGGGATGAGAAVLYYVMPYEPGRSLRGRLDARGPVPVQEALSILRDVCDGLSHAHAHGIVHSDIKPENVLLSGRHAMITDFGVARALSDATDAPAVVGTAVGTPAYMAPEQAVNAGTVDQRSDIYSVGVLACELLDGTAPGGADRQAAGAALARRHPEVAPELARVIARCLASDPRDRWQSAEELRDRLTRILASPHGPPGRLAWPRVRMVALFAAAAAGAVLVLDMVARARDHRPASRLAIGRASQLTSDVGLEVQPTISPDGRRVAYAQGHSLRMRILVRSLDGGAPTPLTADTIANQWLPQWSPDGTRLLFLGGGGVYSAPAGGGGAREEIASRPGAIVTSATWSPDGREIAYVRGDSLIARRMGSGATRLIATGADLHSCSWSRDGRRLACVAGNSFYVTVGSTFGLGPMFANRAPSRIVVIPASGGAPVSVTDSSSMHQSPVWMRDGRTLLYVSNRNGPRDVYAIDVATAATALPRPVRITTGMGAHSIALARDERRIVYAAYTSSANVWALPIPRETAVSASSAVAVTSGNQTVEGIRVSADGRWLVYDSDLGGSSDVYRIPIGGGPPERLTDSPTDEFRGVISPDGTELVYHSYQTGSRNLFLRRLRDGATRQLTNSSGQRAMANWSPDGSSLTLFDIATAEVMVMRRSASGTWGAARVLAQDGVRPEWSPDGRTLAYVSRLDGRISLVDVTSRRRRSIHVPRGDEPRAELAIFSRDGREIYFKSHDALGHASFWSIPVEGGRPRLLTRFDDPARASNRFEFASDGKRLYFTIEDRQSDIWVADVDP